MMKDSYHDAYGAAIVYVHTRELTDDTITAEQLMSDGSPGMIAITGEYLKKIESNVAGWGADFGKEMMTKEKA